MAVRETLQLGNPVLQMPCAELNDLATREVDALAQDLADTLADWVHHTGYGRGIAAPQIGESMRMVHLPLDRPWELINPKIVARPESTWAPWDACLSFSAEIFCKVRRSTWIDVTYQSLDGHHHTLRADAELGELLQHEIDHLDGYLAADRITSIDTLFMRSESERPYRDESPYRQ